MAGTGAERMDRSSCESLLRSTSTGRVAVRHGGDLVMAPVHYALVDDEIVFRAPPGPLLDAAVMGSRVAIEIDGTDHDGSSWCVVASGYADEVTDAREQDRLHAHELPAWGGTACEHVVRVRCTTCSGERGRDPLIDLAGVERSRRSARPVS